MQGQRVSAANGKLTMQVGSGVVDERNATELSTVRVVYRENGLFQGEEPFYVFTFPKVVWVVPDDTPGLAQLWRSIKPFAQDRVQRVDDVHLPWLWRRRLLGLVPVFPLPRLGSFPETSSPPWPATTVVSPDRYDEMI